MEDSLAVPPEGRALSGRCSMPHVSAAVGSGQSPAPMCADYPSIPNLWLTACDRDALPERRAPTANSLSGPSLRVGEYAAAS